jgi:hypothetical protein
MIAFDLAEYVEHTTDVDGMLDRMTPEQFDEWCLRDQIIPIGYQTKMTAYLAWMLANYFSDEPVKPDTLMPWLRFENTDRPQNEKARQMLKSVLGN